MNESNNSRSSRAQLAQNTLQILDRGSYVNGNEETLSIREELSNAIRQSSLSRLNSLEHAKQKVAESLLTARNDSATIEVTKETTLQAIQQV